jgi:hypothetical protein
MITNKSSRQQLRDEVQRLTKALTETNRKRASEFESWALRCRTLKRQNEKLLKELEWLRSVKNVGDELLKLRDQLHTHELACGWTRAPLTEAEDRSSGG